LTANATAEAFLPPAVALYMPRGGMFPWYSAPMRRERREQLPATTQETRDRSAAHTGASDASPAVTAFFSPRLILFLAATVAFFLSMFLPQSALPQYLNDRGAHAGIIGLVVGVLSVGAVAPRPWLGRAMDRGALVPLLLLGTTLMLLTPLYSVGDSLPLLLAVRLVQGVASAVFVTGGPLLVAALTPPARRGEAVGYFNLASTLAIAIGPPVGLILGQQVAYSLTFALAAGAAFVALLLLIPFLRTYHKRSAFTGAPTLAAGALIEWAVLPAALPGFVVGLANGTLFSFVVPLMAARHLPGAGFFFTLDAIAFFTVRAIAGRWADRYGRWRVIVPALGVVAASFVLLAAVPTLPAFVVAALLWGGAISILIPELNTLAIDLAPEGRQGAAAATYTGVFEAGIALGGIALGWLADRTTLVAVFFLVAALFVVTAIVSSIRNRQ